MTIILALAHAFRTNKGFDPIGLYLATFFIDIAIIEKVF